MNAKTAKKLRWYARVQEMHMPDPVVNSDGVSSLLLIYHRRKFSNGDPASQTIQYNPRTSGKGFYRVLKKKRATLRGSIAWTRFMCQRRIVELLGARRARDSAVSAGAAAQHLEVDMGSKDPAEPRSELPV